MRDFDVWINKTTGNRLLISFRNGSADKITKGETIGFAAKDDRLYIIRVPDKIGVWRVVIKQRGGNRQIKNGSFYLSKKMGEPLCSEISNYIGAHNLKFDNGRQLYYIERGA